jgi:hypothetical protein
MKKLLILMVCSMSVIAFVSCKKKGPADKVGEKLDEAIENVQDAVNPEGPVEKVGEKIDDALSR